MSNPLMSTMMRERRGDQIDVGRSSIEPGPTLTRGGVASATITALLIVFTVAAGVYVLGQTNPALAVMCNLIGAGGLFAITIMSMIIRSWRNGSLLSTVILSIFEGLMAGGFTYSVANQFVRGISAGTLIQQALIATFSVFIISAALYYSGMIRVTSKMRSFIMMATLGAAVFYGINFVITLVTGNNLLFSSGPIPMIIAGLAIVLASMSLITSFDDADTMIASAAPDRTKWAMASAIMIDVVWMYMEILRLLALLNRN